MASSVAPTVASNSSPMRSLGSMASGTVPFASPTRGFAVEKATNRSPDPLPATLPVRARPRAARRASRFSWCGSSGASVATTIMMEPVSLESAVPRRE